jgi:hypothetical protein
MKQKYSKLGTLLTKAQSKKIQGGFDDSGSGTCDQDVCKAKSTSDKSCTCSTAWDKCLCTTIIVSE